MAIQPGWSVLLKDATKVLERAGVPGASGDARRLLAFALGIDRGLLMLAIGEPAKPEQVTDFQALIVKRVARQPVSQIIGSREFYGRRFKVTTDVLDPRPDTETLIEVALQTEFNRVLDLGTGSGSILVTLLCERANASGIGADLSGMALGVAKENATANNVQTRAEFRVSDWYSNIAEPFDLIVSNPPYISEQEYAGLEPEVLKWEPEIALTPGGDGLNAYCLIVADAGSHLIPGGRLIVEIGPSQGDKVSALFAKANFDDVCVQTDIDGRNRVVSGRFSGNKPP